MRLTLGSSALALLVLALGWSAPAHSQNGVSIRSMGYCLDVDAGGTANGTNVQIWTCHGGDPQRWIFHPDGTIRRASFPNLCLDIDRGSNAPGTNVQIWQCNGGLNQRWVLDGGAIRSAIPGSMCLDIWQGIASAGTNVESWNCNGQINQQWSIQ
jgi:alpha-galactosidase